MWSEIDRRSRPGEPDPIKRLSQILNQFSLKTSADLKRLSRSHRDDLDQTTYAWFAGYRTPIVAAVKELDGLNLCFPWDERYRSYDHESGMGTAVKKSVMLSNSSIVTVPPFRHPGLQCQSIPTSWYQLVLNFWPLVSSGLLRILPESSTNLVETHGVEGPETSSRKGLGFTMQRPKKVIESTWIFIEEDVGSLRRISLSNRALKQQMEESSSSLRPGRERFYVYLPHLIHVDPDTLAKLRMDHPDVFGLYNHTIHSFFEESEIADNEHALLDALRKTDEEIRKTETEFKKLSKLGALQAGGATVKLMLGVLCAYLPDPHLAGEWKNIVACVAGSGALTDLRSYISMRADRADLAKENAFYFPWLVNRK